MDILLKDGDIEFQNGDFVAVTGPEEVVQRIQIDCGTRLGEFDFNTENGLDPTQILDKATEDDARAEMYRILAREDSIATIEDVEITSNYRERNRTITFSATLTSGEEVSEEVQVDA